MEEDKRKGRTGGRVQRERDPKKKLNRKPVKKKNKIQLGDVTLI